MRTIGSYEAKTHLPRLLDEVEAGGSYTITKHGRPVARLVPTRRRPNSDDLMERLAAFRAELARRGPVGTSIREAIEEGRL